MNKTQICNAALARLGTVLVLNVDTEDSKAAITCRTFWDLSRDELLEAMDWNFARSRAVLAQDATAPAFEYLYRYVLPNDCLKVRKVYATEEPVWEAEGGYLLINESTDVYIRYTSRQTDVSKYTPAFANCLSILLAANIATRLLNDAGKTRIGMLKELEHYIAIAQTTDAREGNAQETIGHTLWTKENR